MTDLSICIPTYNRAAFIEETLWSVLAQADEKLEICLSDNASTDATVSIAHSVLAKFQNARIAVAPVNRGADANFLSAVAIARSPYCLILGSDDTLAPQAISRIRSVIANGNLDIVSFDRRMHTVTMRPIRTEHMRRNPLERTFDFRRPAALDEWLAGAQSLCAAFSYLSSAVFRKSAWDAVPDADRWLDSAYVHSYKLLSACLGGAQMQYLPEPLVNCRIGNDSFRDRGLCQRMLIDLYAFARLAALVDRNGFSRAARHLRTLLRTEYPFWRIVRYQRLLSEDPQWKLALDLLRREFGVPLPSLCLASLLGGIPGVARASFMFRDSIQAIRCSR